MLILRNLSPYIGLQVVVNPFGWDAYLAQPHQISDDGFFHEFRTAMLAEADVTPLEPDTAHVPGRAEVLRVVLRVAASITGASTQSCLACRPLRE